MKTKILAQGAEAKIILLNKFVIKDRIKKFYRIPELDKKIRKSRTKAETKLLDKASKIIFCPAPEKSEDFDKIKMPFIEGKKLSEHLDKFPVARQKQICKIIGKEIAKLHNENIIHGDLTTSNMILVEEKNIQKFLQPKGEGSSNFAREECGKFRTIGGSKNFYQPVIFFIDFGLGYFNGKFEDKAVDLHLLKQALEARHFKHWETLWKNIEEGYKTSKNSKKVLERLKSVEKRGRYKK